MILSINGHTKNTNTIVTNALSKGRIIK